MRKIDDHEYTVEISCYFLTKWKDDRLVLSDEILSKRRKHLKSNASTFASEAPHAGKIEVVSIDTHGVLSILLYAVLML